MDELELALEDCLQQLASGTISLGQCISRYPRYAAQLRSMLEAAVRLQQGRQVRPSGALRDRTRARLAEHMESHPGRPPRGGHAIPKFAVTLVALAFALFMVGTAFAQAALPGQTLYNWKLSTERAWRATSADQVSFDLTLADRRTDELLTVSKDRSLGETDGIAAYTELLNRLAAETNGPNRAKVMNALESHQKKLSQAGIHVPELDEIVSHSKGQAGQGHDGSKPSKP